jgi:hypothetical protein
MLENYEYYEYIFFIFIIATLYMLYAVVIFSNKTEYNAYIDTIHYYLNIYVSIYLIFRFNPFTKIEFTRLDKKVCFTSGLIVFTTTQISKILIQYATVLKNKIIN